MTRLRLASATLAVLVATVAGLLAGLLPGHHPETVRLDFDEANLAAAASVPAGDRVQAAIDGVQDTGFYVAPELRGELSEDEIAGIEQIIGDAQVPLFVVWWGDTRDGGYNTPYAAIDQLRVGVGQDGYYAIVTQGSNPLLEALGYASPYVDADAKGRPAAALTRYVTALAAEPPEPETEPGSGSDYWGGVGGGIGAGLLFAGLGYVGLLIVVGVLGAALPRPRREGPA